MPSKTQDKGASTERIAENRLIETGYRIVERNWRGGGGEIDRVAWDGDTLCFIEVRGRSDDAHGGPAETVGWRKQRCIVRAAMAYLFRFDGKPMPLVRFDVVAVLGGGREGASVEIIRNAFDAGG